MRELLEYLLEGVTGNKDFVITSKEEEGHLHFSVNIPRESIGIVIGKGGNTIKVIRNLLRVRATLEKNGVTLSIEESQ